MARIAFALGTLMAAMAAAPGGASAQASAHPLQSYFGAQRPLIVFAPTRSDFRLREQAEIIDAAEAGLKTRDVVVVLVVGSDVSVRFGAPLRVAATDLRRAYRMPRENFCAVLVGKDGTVKLRNATPVPASRLFSLIDAMPMRQREMRR